MPERGYHLELITPVPLPRKPSADLLRLPLRVRRAVRETRDGARRRRRRRHHRLRRLRRGARLPGGARDAGCRWSSTKPTPAPVGPTSSVPDRRAGCCPRWPIPACRAPRSSGCRFARRSLHWTGWRSGQRPAPTSDSPTTHGCCWCSAVRRVRSRSTGPSHPRQGPRRGRYFGAARTWPEEHPRSARARRRRPAIRGRAVSGPDGPGLCRSRSGDLPVRRDDGCRGVRRRAACGVRPAAHRQRRAATQRAARRRCGRRAARRRRRPHARRSSPTPSPGCSATPRGSRR